MKKLFSILFLFVIFYSCKSGANKLEINDIQGHRAYQDSIIAKGKDPKEKFLLINKLIAEYRDIKNKDTNSNYNYLIARLYSNIIFNKDLPLNGFVYDSVNKKMNDSRVFINFMDSTFYYSELSLKQNPNNIFSMNIMTLAQSFEQQFCNNLLNNGIKVPYSSNRDFNSWNRRLNYIVNNSLRFDSVDTTKDKSYTRVFVETSFQYLTITIDSRKIDLSNDNDLNLILTCNNYINYIDKFGPIFYDNNDYKKKSKELLPFTRIAIEKVKLAPIKNFIDKELYQRGWSSTDHSLDEDIQTSKGSLIEYTNASPSESELVFRLNSDYSYNITFKPIRYISTVTVTGKWILGENSSIEFDKDIFVSVPVTSADFPLSVEPFHEYILIPKKVQIFNGYLVLDKRSTDRNTFFAQLAIVQQGNNISSETYAFNSLSELSLTKELLTQYLCYFK
jgi:hypothetical protein